MWPSRCAQGVSTDMASTKSKLRKSTLRMTGAFAALATLALAVSCRGFFVKPTVSAIAVGPPTPTIEVGPTSNTVQMTTFATFNDGSTCSTPVTWSISPSDGSIATISASGLVTSVATGSATVTATANLNPTISGQQTVNVTVGCISSIQVTPTNPAALTGNNPSVTLMAEATTCNGQFNLTSTATWTSSNTSLATVSAGVVTEVAGNQTTGTVAITATVGTVVSNVVNISVGP